MALCSEGRRCLTTPGELEVFGALREELRVDAATLIVRWAVQNGMIAFPSLRAEIAAGAEIKSAKKYAAWTATLLALLRARTLHLHSPTEHSRVDIPAAGLAKLDALDREQAIATARFDALIQGKAPE